MNLCECGCRKEVKNRFVSGHNFKVRPTILFGEKNGFYGKTHTEDNKKKCSAPHIGRKQSEKEKTKRVESSRKTRNERYGKWLSNNAIEKIRVSNTDKTHSEDTKEKIRQSSLNRLDEVNNKIGESVKALWKNEDYRNRQVKAHTGKIRSDESTRKWAESCALKPNKAEIFTDNLIQKARPTDFIYSGGGKIFIAGKVPDWFNVNGKKQVIEMLGTYWHSEKMTGRTKEQEENYLKSHYKKYGYDCLIIWESELKNTEQVIEKVKQF